MKGKPLISIIIPVYQARKVINRCVESVIGQTYVNLEIILIDDGSTDGSNNLCHIFERMDSRIKYIRQANAGVSAARNAGINMARGSWIGFVDADDWIESDMFEKLLGAAVNRKKEIAVCGHIKHFDNNWTENLTHAEIPSTICREEFMKYVLLDRYFEGSLANKLFSRNLIEKEFPLRVDESIHVGEDIVFAIQAALRTDGAAYVPEALYHYCIRKNSAMTSFSQKRLSEIDAAKHVLELVFPVSKYLEELARLRYTTVLVSVIHSAVSANKYDGSLKKEALRYAKTYFLSSQISVGMKFRNALLIFFPKSSLKIWGKVKSKFNITWWRKELTKANER